MKKLLLILLFTPLINYGQLTPRHKAQVDSLQQIIKTAKHDTTVVNAWIAWDNIIYASDPTLDFQLNQKIDSLCNINLNKTLPKKTKTAFLKSKGFALNNLGIIYQNQGDHAKAIDYCTKSLKIREEVGDKKGMADTYNNIGNSYQNQGAYAKAIDYHTKSLKIKEELGNKNGMADTYNNIGNIYLGQGDYAKAIDYHTKSLQIREEVGGQSKIAASLNNIGLIYKEQDDYPKALDYFSQSLQLGDQSGIAASLNNIGIIYREQGDYPKALEYFSQSLKIQKQLGYQSGIATSLNNIGDVYKDQGDYAKAIDYQTKSLKIYDEIGDKTGIVYCLNSIGKIYLDQGDYPKALVFCEKGYQLALSIGGLLVQKHTCQCLYDTYKALGNSNKALTYHELLNAIDDSLDAVETGKMLQQMEFSKQMFADSIASAEKERLIEEAHQEEVRQGEKIRNIGFGVGFIFLLAAGGFYSRWRYVRKSKANLQVEKDRSENLLLNILPADIAEELKTKGKADARDFDLVSILFTDFNDFTAASEKMSAKDLVTNINYCFEAFDAICEKYKVEKIKTIGDAYMAAGGLPIPSDESVKNTVLAALEMQRFITQLHKQKEAKGENAFEMRVGVHTGPVVAGIVGVKKFQYDIWGDAVNTASRMESKGEVGKVNISQATYDLLKDDSEVTFESRGKIEAKGKGEIEMYFVSKN